jgi:thioredoxin-related protein
MRRNPFRFVLVLSCIAVLASVSLQALPAQASAAKVLVPAEPPRPAQELMDAAVVRAAADHKAVLVKFGASWCGWCLKFDKFLEDTTGVGQIMRANFVVVGLTVLESAQYKAFENPGGADIAKAMGGDISKIGIPWFFMLDGAGKKIGDSNMMPDHGNIGMPDFPIEVTGFIELMKQTAPKMTENDRDRIKAYLDRAAGRTVIVP